MNQRPETTCPNEILDLIPWYPDQGLSAEQCASIEAHAAECEACRSEVEILSGGKGSPTSLPDREAVYGRTLGLIEAYEMTKEPRVEPVRLARAGRNDLGAGGVRYYALAASLIVMLLAGMAIGRLVLPSGDTVYRTATEGAAPQTAPAGQAELDVMFRGDSTADRLRAVLRAIGGNIVEGPSRLGVYRVRLGADGDAAAAAAMLLGDGQGVATFAEPIQP